MTLIIYGLVTQCHQHYSKADKWLCISVGAHFTASCRLSQPFIYFSNRLGTKLCLNVPADYFIAFFYYLCAHYCCNDTFPPK